jgi:hypothetical protein
LPHTAHKHLHLDSIQLRIIKRPGDAATKRPKAVGPSHRRAVVSDGGYGVFLLPDQSRAHRDKYENDRRRRDGHRDCASEGAGQGDAVAAAIDPEVASRTDRVVAAVVPAAAVFAFVVMIGKFITTKEHFFFFGLGREKIPNEQTKNLSRRKEVILKRNLQLIMP